MSKTALIYEKKQQQPSVVSSRHISPCAPDSVAISIVHRPQLWHASGGRRRTRRQPRGGRWWRERRASCPRPNPIFSSVSSTAVFLSFSSSYCVVQRKQVCSSAGGDAAEWGRGLVHLPQAMVQGYSFAQGWKGVHDRRCSTKAGVVWQLSERTTPSVTKWPREGNVRHGTPFPRCPKIARELGCERIIISPATSEYVRQRNNHQGRSCVCSFVGRPVSSAAASFFVGYSRGTSSGWMQGESEHLLLSCVAAPDFLAILRRSKRGSGGRRPYWCLEGRLENRSAEGGEVLPLPLFVVKSCI